MGCAPQPLVPQTSRLTIDDIDMTNSIAHQIVLAARPKGRPQLTDFRLEETAIPTPASRQLLLGVQYLSLDPYMRGRMDDRKSYATPLQLGDVMSGESVAKVLASNHPDYAEGDIVIAPTGWRTHALSDGTRLRKLDPAVAPVTTGLGVLGMPGFTAYGGMRVIGKPQPGETVVVAAASGPVGSLVGQLASSPAPGRSALPAARRNAPLSKTSSGLTRRSITVPPIFSPSWRPPVRMASTSISRMSAARSGRRCCRCSISTRASRSAV